MRNFFTWFIAILLFGLCILEKESSKNARLLDSVDGNYTQPTSGHERRTTQGLVIKTPGQNKGEFASENDGLNIQSAQFLPADSLHLSSRL